MKDFLDFKTWLEDNTDYSSRTIGNMVSRMKRANGILPWFDDDLYLFRIERCEEFQKLNCSVKSQLRKAIKLYFEYKRKAK